jgi:hypothetical protein
MELPFLDGAVTGPVRPPTELVLNQTRLELDLSPDQRFVFLIFPIDSLGLTIRIPWERNDFRLMLQRMLAGTVPAETNGQ